MPNCRCAASGGSTFRHGPLSFRSTPAVRGSLSSGVYLLMRNPLLVSAEIPWALIGRPKKSSVDRSHNCPKCLSRVGNLVKGYCVSQSRLYNRRKSSDYWMNSAVPGGYLRVSRHGRTPSGVPLCRLFCSWREKTFGTSRKTELSPRLIEGESRHDQTKHSRWQTNRSQSDRQQVVQERIARSKPGVQKETSGIQARKVSGH